KGSGRRRVAVGVGQRVVAEERELRAGAKRSLQEHLIFAVDAFRREFVHVLESGDGRHARRWARIKWKIEAARQRTIYVVGKELIPAARVQIRKRDVRNFRYLPFQADGGLHHVRRA